MLPDPKTLKGAASITLWFFLILLAGACVFYRERMILDAAYISFHIVHYGHLNIQANRYGSFITQMVPLIAAKMHVPLKTLLIAYSASFNIFPLLVALLLYRARQYALVILMGLYFSLYVSDTYFWTNNELHQGVCWMFLMLAHILYQHQRANTPLAMAGYYLVFTLLAFLAIYTHVSVMIPMGFLWVFYILKRKSFQLSTRTIIIHTVIFAVIFLFKLQSSLQHSYDSANILKLDHLGIHDVLDTFTGDFADRFWKGSFRNYWLLSLLFLAGLYILIRKKEFLLLSWVVVCNLAFFVLACIIFGNGLSFHMESELMPFAILGCTPFVYFLLPVMPSKRILFLMVFIFLVRMVYIGFAAEQFCRRVATVTQITRYMKTNGITKMIIPEDPLLWKRLTLPWALPMESLYTSLAEDGVMRTAICVDEGRLARMDTALSRQVFLDPFGDINQQEFSRDYYFRPDTTHNYQVVYYSTIVGH